MFFAILFRLSVAAEGSSLLGPCIDQFVHARCHAHSAQVCAGGTCECVCMYIWCVYVWMYGHIPHTYEMHDEVVSIEHARLCADPGQ